MPSLSNMSVQLGRGDELIDFHLKRQTNGKYTNGRAMRPLKLCILLMGFGQRWDGTLNGIVGTKYQQHESDNRFSKIKATLTFPSTLTPTHIGWQCAHACFHCIQHHERFPVTKCIRGTGKCERCQAERMPCNQEGQIPVYESDVKQYCYAYRIALELQRDRWAPDPKFWNTKEMERMFGRELLSHRYRLADEVAAACLANHDDVSFNRRPKCSYKNVAQAIERMSFLNQTEVQSHYASARRQDEFYSIKLAFPHNEVIQNAQFQPFILPNPIYTKNSNSGIPNSRQSNMPADRVLVFPSRPGNSAAHKHFKTGWFHRCLITRPFARSSKRSVSSITESVTSDTEMMDQPRRSSVWKGKARQRDAPRTPPRSGTVAYDNLSEGERSFTESEILRLINEFD